MIFFWLAMCWMVLAIETFVMTCTMTSFSSMTGRAVRWCWKMMCRASDTEVVGVT